MCDAVTGARDSRAILDSIERVDSFSWFPSVQGANFPYRRLFRRVARREPERREPRDARQRSMIEPAIVSRCRDGVQAIGRPDCGSGKLITWLRLIDDALPSRSRIRASGKLGRAVDRPAPPRLYSERRPVIYGPGKDHADGEQTYGPRWCRPGCAARTEATRVMTRRGRRADRRSYHGIPAALRDPSGWALAGGFALDGRAPCGARLGGVLGASARFFEGRRGTPEHCSTRRSEVAAAGPKPHRLDDHARTLRPHRRRCADWQECSAMVEAALM